MIDLTPAQQVQIIAVNRQVNFHTPHSDGRGHGNCVGVALAKRDALLRAGIPPEAVTFKEVAAPRGWSQPYHLLIQIVATVNGAPWPVTLDMLDDDPLTPAREAAFGYTRVAGGMP